MEQRSEEWFAARRGRVTASRIADVMATLKNGSPGASRAAYEAELVTEILTGQSAPRFENDAMRWGTETEPQARASYSLEVMQPVEEVGFVVHPTILDAGASPDGLVGSDGLVEIKCPNTATHIKTLRDGSIDGKYIKQMQFQMACTDRKWCDFVSFDPRLPDEMQLWIKRIERDDDAIAAINAAVRAFMDGVHEAVADLRAKYGAEAPDAPLMARV